MTTASETSIGTETVAVPLDGATEAEVRLGFGGGELAIGAAEPGMLLSGTCDGGVVVRRPAPDRVALEPHMPTAIRGWRPLRWDLGITAAIPVDLVLETGANRTTVDLSSLRIRKLDLRTGASETNVRLPAAGRTAVHVECGFASVTLEVPATMAARVRGHLALGATVVATERFPRTADGWAAAGFETASDRVDIQITGGFGTVRVV
jgi:hypothetical protein